MAPLNLDTKNSKNVRIMKTKDIDQPRVREIFLIPDDFNSRIVKVMKNFDLLTKGIIIISSMVLLMSIFKLLAISNENINMFGLLMSGPLQTFSAICGSIVFLICSCLFYHGVICIMYTQYRKYSNGKKEWFFWVIISTLSVTTLYFYLASSAADILIRFWIMCLIIGLINMTLGRLKPFKKNQINYKKHFYNAFYLLLFLSFLTYLRLPFLPYPLENVKISGHDELITAMVVSESVSTVKLVDVNTKLIYVVDAQDISCRGFLNYDDGSLQTLYAINKTKASDSVVRMRKQYISENRRCKDST